MDGGVHVDAVDLDAASVVVEEVDEGAGVEVVVKRGGGVNADAQRRDICADADAGKTLLVPDCGPGNAFPLRVGKEAVGGRAAGRLRS
jgi:hypothetical protein